MTLEHLIKKEKTTRSISKEEILDLSKSIADAIVKGIYTNISPECIEVGENNSTEISQRMKSENAFFMAPEQIFDCKKPDRSTALFSFGMVFYYINRGENWYAANGISVYDAHEKNISFQIEPDEFPELNYLVSVNPKEREAGFKAFLTYYQSLPKGKLTIEYKADNNIILTEELRIRETRSEYAKGKKIKARNRDIYIVKTGVEISPKLSTQKITVPVVLFKKAGDVIREIWYRTEHKGRSYESLKAVDYDELDCGFDVPVNTEKVDRIQFLMIQHSVSTGKKEEKTICTINLSSSYRQCSLRVLVRADVSMMRVSLYDQNRSKLINEDELTYNLPDMRKRGGH